MNNLIKIKHKTDEEIIFNAALIFWIEKVDETVVLIDKKYQYTIMIHFNTEPHTYRYLRFKTKQERDKAHQYILDHPMYELKYNQND